MKNVLILSKFNFDYKGGIEKEAHRVALQLSKNYKVTTFAFSNKNKKTFISKNNTLIEFKSVRILNKIDFSLKYFLFIILNIRKFRFVWLHYPNIFPSLFASIFKSKNNILISHWHNDIQVLPFLYYFFRPIEKLLISRSSKIITTSPDYHSHSKVLKDEGPKIEVIPICIDDIYNSQYSIQRNKLYKPIKLLSVGRITEYKGYNELINIVKSNNDYELTIVSNNNFDEKTNKDIESSNNIFHKRGISDTELIDLYFDSHIYVLSSISRNEGFGIVLIEALRSGLPLCVNFIDGVGSSYINLDGVTGKFFNIDDPNSFHESVRLITEDDTAYSKYSENARNRFSSTFNAESDHSYVNLITKLS